ncbi:MAG: hypothetical protein DI527_18835 [Chelatococcus sp.]|nr:MAG: hypothetical protein DI527_18835 [Chelatococcus sp.]
MIIRRRRTRNFTIVENEVFNDERLSLDAMGLLAWLRSRPDDWCLSVDHLRTRFKVGRDTMHRLVRELVEAGWITRQRQRDEVTKAFTGMEYVVLDEAAPPNAGGDAEKPSPEIQDVAQPDRGGLFPVCAEPHTDLPGPANQDEYIRTDSYQELSHTPLPPAQPEAGQEGVCASPSVLGQVRVVIADPPRPPVRFEDIAEGWPWEDGESRIQAEAAFERLSEDERRMALDHAGDFVRARQRSSRKRAHLKTYFGERLFRDFGGRPPVALPPKQVFVAVGTQEFAAWDRAYRRCGRPGMPSSSSHKGRQGWWRPTAWPSVDWTWQGEQLQRSAIRDGPGAA